MQCLKKLRGLLAFYCLGLFLHPLMVDGQATLHLTVVPPYYTPLIDQIHAAGTMNGWQETGGISQMTPNIDGTYSISFNGTPGQLVEYKYVRGDWARVETQLNGAFLPNRSFVFANGITVTDTVWNWEDQLGLHTAVGNTHILTIAFNMPQLGRTRQVWVYLPQDYYVSSDSFPVLYMQDGQNLFDEVSTAFGTEWAVDETMVAREADLADRRHYYLACLYFKSGEFAKALHVILASPKCKPQNADWDTGQRFLKLMVLMEMNAVDAVDQELESLRKHLEKAKKAGRQNQRWDMIYGLAKRLNKSGFNFKKLVADASSSITVLASDAPGYRWMATGSELIPFHLWVLEKANGFCGMQEKAGFAMQQRSLVGLSIDSNPDVHGSWYLQPRQSSRKAI